MPIKLPSDLLALDTPASTDILIGQRPPEKIVRQLTLADILALVPAPVITDGSIGTSKLASGAITNIAQAGISAGITLKNYYDTIIDCPIVLQTPYSSVLVLAYFAGYGYRNSGTGDYGVELELKRVGSTAMMNGYAGYAQGGASSAARVGGSAMLMGVHWTGASPGAVTFRLSARYFSTASGGYCVGGTIVAFEMKR